MRRMAYVMGLLLTIFMLSVATVNAYTWETYRNDITIESGMTDINDRINLSDYTGTGTNVSGVVKLPCNIDNITTIFFNVSNDGAATIYYNLTVNSIDVNLSDTVAAYAKNETSKSNYTAASGSVTLENITWSFNASSYANLSLYLYAVDADMCSYWLSQNIVMTERDVIVPEVVNSRNSGQSFWTVNDSINTSFTWGYNLSGILLNITYPSNKVTNGSANISIASATNDSSDEQYTQYQKRGPYVYSVDESIDGSKHTVTIKLKSPEILRDCVDWTLLTNADCYDDYFDTLDYSTLDVELNGIDQSWSQGSVVFEEIDVKTSPTNNEWTFEWTVSTASETGGGVSTPVEQVANVLTSQIFILPNWLWIVIIISAIVLVVVYVKYKKK